MKFILFFLVTLTLNETVFDSSQYSLKTYKDFFTFVTTLQDDPKHNDLIKVEDVFNKYSTIQRPDCEADFTGKCKSYLFTITDFTKGPTFYNKLPTVLLIGGFHGNEVTGTNSLYRLIEIFYKYGKINPYLQELLSKVKILILPTANVTGFSKETREDYTNPEQPVDPNRDFPFNQKKNDKCLQTSTAQVIDQIFRNNLILSTLTFHGGDNSITYPWGNFAHKDPITGDNLAFKQIANLLKDFAGANDDLDIEEYTVGTMKDIVYDVNGGFEDWAYGASWDKKNVPTTTDGKHNIPPYNSITNRSFVYLVEAGYDKVPLDYELGNELSIFHPYDEEAIWGHISRNTFMSLKFLEYQNPYIVVDEVRYNRGLVMKLIVKGCVHVSYLKINNWPFFILSKKVQPDTGYHVILVIIEKTVKYMDDISIEAQCDQEWYKESSNLKPQTHFVKLRTDPGYEIMYKDQTLKSQYLIKSRLINLKISEIKDAFLISSDNNIYSFIYTTEYKIKMPTDLITAYWEDGLLKFETKTGLHYRLKVFNYGTDSCCTNDTNGTFAEFELSTIETQPISQKQFFQLLGKHVDIFDPRVNQNIYYSYFTILNEDPYSTLVLPSTGLTSFSEIVDEYYRVTVTQFTEDMVKIQLMTNIENQYQMQIGSNINISLELDTKFQKTQGVVQYQKFIKLKNYNDFRMWGAYMKLINSSDKVVYKDILKPLNPYFNELDEIKKSNGFLIIEKHIENQKLKSKFFKQSNESKKPIIFIVLIVVVILIAMGYFFTKGKEDDKENKNDQTNLQVQAKNDTNKILVNQI